MTVKQIRNHPSFRDAVCKRNKLCNFEVIESNDEVQKEVCSFCKKQIRYNKINGKVDQLKYGRDHVRDFLQPGPGAYEEIYGTSWRERKKPKQGPTTEEIKAKAKEIATFLERKENQGYKIDDKRVVDKLFGDAA